MKNVDHVGFWSQYSIGLDSAAKSTQQQSLQPVLRLRPTCAGITFEGRVAFAMKKIALTQGKHALVDDQDYEYLNQWKWRVCIAKRKQTGDTWYAQRTTPRPNRKCITMHREVAALMGFENPTEVDHEDHNGLNNQRYNLRPCTVAQNRWNTRKKNGCTSKFKGVYWHKTHKKGWMARIYCLGKHYYLGLFDKEKDAAKAYDAAARIHFGEFARLNFP